MRVAHRRHDVLVRGLRNVTAAYGVQGFTDEMLEALRSAGVQRVYIASDPDEAGQRGAEAWAERLLREGIECLRVELPGGLDANEFALASRLRKRAWGGCWRRPAR